MPRRPRPASSAASPTSIPLKSSASSKAAFPRQYLWIGLKSTRRRSKDLARHWRWMKDPLTPEAAPINLRQYIRVDMNQEWADCMNILDDRLNDYFCHEALPFICEFTLPHSKEKDSLPNQSIEDDNHLHRDIAASINAVNSHRKQPHPSGVSSKIGHPVKLQAAQKPHQQPDNHNFQPHPINARLVLRSLHGNWLREGALLLLMLMDRKCRMSGLRSSLLVNMMSFRLRLGFGSSDGGQRWPSVDGMRLEVVVVWLLVRLLSSLELHRVADFRRNSRRIY